MLTYAIGASKVTIMKNYACFFWLQAVLIAMLCQGAALAEVDPWLGSYRIKDDKTIALKKLTLSPDNVHHCRAALEIRTFLGEGSGKDKKILLHGYGDLYSELDDKGSEPRLFIWFPKEKYSPFMEIYAKSIEKNKSVNSLLYAYFENSRWRFFERGELVRELTKKTAARKFKRADGHKRDKQ